MLLLLAPLQGTTEFPFRNAWLKHFSGLDAAYSPFISSVTGNKVKRSFLKDILPGNNDPHLPLVPQVLGNKAAGLLLMAEAFATLGFTGMNLNMGCPSATVVRHGRGCGLMPQPKLVGQLLEEVMPRIPIPLSVKLRSGLKSSDELCPMLEVLNAFPLKEIILHPRLGSQMYGGEVDLDVFASALTVSRHPVVYNGDITTVAMHSALRERFPQVDAWMLGRGVLMNPFLPGLLKGNTLPPQEEVKTKLLAFHDTLIEHVGLSTSSEQRLAAKMKEYWGYFSHWFADREHVWQDVRRSSGQQGLQAAVGKAFTLPLAISP